MKVADLVVGSASQRQVSVVSIVEQSCCLKEHVKKKTQYVSILGSLLYDFHRLQKLSLALSFRAVAMSFFVDFFHLSTNFPIRMLCRMHIHIDFTLQD